MGCSVLVLPEDPSAMAQAILDLSKQPKLLDSLGANERNYVAAHFGRHRAIKRYHHLLHQVAYKE